MEILMGRNNSLPSCRQSRASQISRKRKLSTERRRPAGYSRGKLLLENLEQRNLLTSVTFQQGFGGYAGTNDTVLFSISPTVNFGTDTAVSVDQQDVNGERQGLLKFDSIIGSDPG